MDLALCIIVASVLATIVIAAVLRFEKNKPSSHWSAYLLATPGDRNAVVWNGKPPRLAEFAKQFLEMYERLWVQLIEVWPDAPQRVAEVGRPRAFAECEAVIAPLIGTDSKIDRFVTAYTLMCMITFDKVLHARLTEAKETGMDLDETAKTYITMLAGESIPDLEVNSTAAYIMQRWKFSPWVGLQSSRSKV